MTIDDLEKRLAGIEQSSATSIRLQRLMVLANVALVGFAVWRVFRPPQNDALLVVVAEDP